MLAVDDSPEAAVAFSWVLANVLRPSDSLALVHVHDPGVGEEQARRKVAKLEELWEGTSDIMRLIISRSLFPRV